MKELAKQLAKQLVKPLLLLAAIIIFCSILAKVVMSGDTLLDYARENPEIAYASPEPVLEEIPDGSEADIFTDEEPLDESYEGAEGADEVPLLSLWSVAGDMAMYQPGFSKEPLSDDLFAYIRGISFPITLEEAVKIIYGDEYHFDFGFIFEDNEDGEHFDNEWDEVYALLPNIVNEEDIEILRDDLVFLSLLHYDYDGDLQLGEMICNIAIADDLLEIFYELFLNEYQLERVSLIEEYGGSDTSSMIYNNTSCFNYRESSPGRLSLHAFGLAVDINPFHNPYVAYNNNGSIRKISPVGSEEFADRSLDFPHKINEDDLVHQLFMERGFFWGGDWTYQKDYQHFQKEFE